MRLTITLIRLLRISEALLDLVPGLDEVGSVVDRHANAENGIAQLVVN